MFVFLEAGYALLGLLGLWAVGWGVHRELAGRPGHARYCTLFVLAVPLGLAGARIIPIVQDALLAGRLSWGIVLRGGLVFYGGFFAALAGMVLGCRLWRLPVWPLLDAVCHFAPLGHGTRRARPVPPPGWADFVPGSG